MVEKHGGENSVGHVGGSLLWRFVNLTESRKDLLEPESGFNSSPAPSDLPSLAMPCVPKGSTPSSTTSQMLII